MKFTKSSLLSSLAAAGMVLGAVAPVIANAATGNSAVESAAAYKNSMLTQDNEGNVSVTSASANLLQNKRNQDGDKVTGYAPGYVAGSGANASSGTAVGTSDAVVKIIEGYLTLDAVPDFNFGTVVPGAKAALQNFSGAISDDGNDQGDLQITDSRSTSAATYSAAPFPATDTDVTNAVSGSNLSAEQKAQITDTVAKAIANKTLTLTADKTAIAPKASQDPDIAGLTDDQFAAVVAFAKDTGRATLSSSSKDGKGYTLSVALGDFKQLNAAGNARTSVDAGSGFSLILPDLTKVTGVVDKDAANSFSFTGTTGTAADNNGGVTASDTGSAMQIAQATSGASFGTAAVHFAKAGAKEGVGLKVGANVSQGAWDAPVYWILNAAAPQA
ncbi:hypothetical protein [Schleiferilactobacillus perolens]|uniref:WxL domain-containing protein n=1 Tax=Schleiferilactobacillus perolens DSM 12744 TaxID=1423792 RepID=A0A0R1MUT1_9LACO|nr:hypothetical protein [Schleiferilactobacillus perolens]KRL11943.1 hypothetical protein FD09_GL000552 [Schleiferilactobacillus perolens DSM 12744]